MEISTQKLGDDRSAWKFPSEAGGGGEHAQSHHAAGSGMGSKTPKKPIPGSRAVRVARGHQGFELWNLKKGGMYVYTSCIYIYTYIHYVFGGITTVF